MKVQDSVLLAIMRCRARLAELRDGAKTQRAREAVEALIVEVDRLPSMASDLFTVTPVAPSSGNDGARFPFANLRPGDHFDVEPGRLSSLRASASGWAKRHGVTLTVREKGDGGGRCARIDGLDALPECVTPLGLLLNVCAPAPAPRPAAGGGDDYDDLVRRGLAPPRDDAAGQ